MPLTLPPPSPPAWPNDLLPLRKELIRQGFHVLLKTPPAAEMYGQFEPKLRTIWIAPVTVPLEIMRTTFLHEAIHAAQSCPHGRMTLLGFKANVLPVVEREINGILSTRYGHANRALEREAFLLQSQPNVVAVLIRALRTRCNLKTT